MGKKRYIILIVAAGSSRRLGQPKQLVKWKGTTLLQHTIDSALELINCDVAVVTGDPLLPISLSDKVRRLANPNWKEGMGSSIAFGVQSIESEMYDGIIISVCDQPFITSNNYKNLISSHQKENKPIVVSSYTKGANGPPVLFDKIYFSKLAELEGEEGGKTIIRDNASEVVLVPFSIGEIDIDTPRDLEQLTKITKQI